MDTDRDLRLANQERLRRLSVQHQADVRVFCAHDVVELERCMAGAPL